MGPGLNVLIRMFRPLRSMIQFRVNASSEAFDAAYTLNAGAPPLAAVDSVIITDAPASSNGNAFWTVKRIPFKFSGHDEFPVLMNECIDGSHLVHHDKWNGLQYTIAPLSIWELIAPYSIEVRAGKHRACLSFLQSH